MRKRQHTSGLQRKKHKRQTERQNAVKRAVPVSGRSPAQSELLSASQARQVLGVSARAFRNHVAQRKITPAAKTPGGHWRFRRQDLETFQAPAQPSPLLRDKRERVEELNAELQLKKAQMALRELTDEERRRTEREEAESQAQEEQARMVQREAAADAARRERERARDRAAARAEQMRQDWEAEWVREMLRILPRDLPPQLRLEVVDVLRQELSELYESHAGNAEDIVETILRAAVQKTLQFWKRSQDVTKAAAEAVEELNLFAKASFGAPSEWEFRAREEALAAIEELPETATLEQMGAAARFAGRHVNQAFLAAEEAARQAQERIRRDAQAEVTRREREWEQARARERAEQEVQQESRKHLERVFSYIIELQADPDGFDFGNAGELYQCSKQIAADIAPDFREDLPLDFLSGRRRVEELVDKWLASHCS
jgi:hypothetical protein